MLSLRGVEKRYGGRRVLGPLDLELERGTTALIGPSGSGKSTILRLLIGLVAPDRGEVRFGDRPLGPDTVDEARRRTGYVIQEGGLFPHLTAEENVTLVARYLRWDPARIAARVAELAALTRLDDAALARFPSELSGGQRQRVSLMRALMLDPDVVLLDEPLGALDPLIRFDLQAELKAIFMQLGKTVVLVTHDLGEAAYLAGRVALLRDGQLVQVGTIEALCDAPADPFVTRFVRAQARTLPRSS